MNEAAVPTKSEEVAKEEGQTFAKDMEQATEGVVETEAIGDEVISNDIEPVSPSAKLAYASNPLTHSIVFILILDFLERFCWYGILFTLPGYLTGYYQPDWNPGFAPHEANAFISMSQAIGFITPFFAAVFADVLIGDYWSINFFTGLCYIPGAFIIASMAIPYSLDHDYFPTNALKIGTHILYPLGFGAAKTLYGVYAAKQYDPIRHTNEIERFFVLFTVVEFIGSFAGAFVSIIVAEVAARGEVVAEFINASALTMGLIIFLAGSRRYVHTALIRKAYMQMIGAICGAVACLGGGGVRRPGFQKTKTSSGGRIPDGIVEGTAQLLMLLPLFALILPLQVAFTQAVVCNIAMAAFLENMSIVKGPLLVSTSLLFIGIWAVIIKKFLMPYLNRRNISLTQANKYALGSLGLGISFAIVALIEALNKRKYIADGSRVSIFYGLFATFFSGMTAFAFAAMNEIAFVVAPAEFKMLGTAIMNFMTMGIPNLIGSYLFKACAHWFEDSQGNKVRSIEQYVDSNSTNFTYLMMGLCFANVLIMLLPPVKKWLHRVEERSISFNLSRAEGSTGDRKSMDIGSSESSKCIQEA